MLTGLKPLLINKLFQLYPKNRHSGVDRRHLGSMDGSVSRHPPGTPCRDRLCRSDVFTSSADESCQSGNLMAAHPTVGKKTSFRRKARFWRLPFAGMQVYGRVEAFHFQECKFFNASEAPIHRNARFLTLRKTPFRRFASPRTLRKTPFRRFADAKRLILTDVTYRSEEGASKLALTSEASFANPNSCQSKL